MCMMKSMILLKNREFVPDYDHHTQMLEELKIGDTRENAQTKFVRIELIPPDGDMFTPVDTWRLNVDQDITPDWFAEEIDSERIVKAVEKWAKNRIYIGVDGLDLSSGSHYYLKDCKNVRLSGNASVERLESSNVGVMWENSNVGVMRENSKVGEMWESSKVGVMRENSNVGVMRESSNVGEMWGSSNVGVMRESSLVHIPEYSSVNHESIVLMDNSTIKDGRTKTLYQAGDWKLVLVNGEAS